MKVEPYKAFFEKFRGKRVPTAKPMQEFLVRDAGVEAKSVKEAATHILSD
jgi:hypothetical protein